MSTIQISFQTQFLDFAPLTRGTVNIIYNDGTQNLNLPLDLTTGVSTSGRFSEVTWIDGASGEDEQQALNFAQAFNRDYSFVGVVFDGGLKQGNLIATTSGNTVTITSSFGTFPDTLSTYNGNVLITSAFTVNNDPVVSSLNLTVLNTSTGDCDIINYTATETGGTSPYTLYNGSNILQSNWDGTLFSFTLNRVDAIANIKVIDAEGLEKEAPQVIPRKLSAGEFNVLEEQFETSSDLVIESLNPVAGTTPLEYSLDTTSATSGSAYQTSNAYSGVLPGTYQLFIKDVYGCVLKKIFTVSDFQDATESTLDYFEINKINSIIFAPCPTFDKDVKKNFENTLSFNSLDGINHELQHRFDPSDTIPVQFKSSYGYHVITLNRCNGTKYDIIPIMIQENLGSKEKVDINLLTVGTQTGFYFDGGNQYEPDTTDIINASEYIDFSPDWAEEGQLVEIDDLGSFRIVSTGYDETLAKTYYLINVSTPLTTGKIQVTHNIQPYNLFEFYLPMSQVTNSGRLVVEYGNAFDEIIGRQYSELIVSDSDTDNLLIQAGSTNNKADFVFTENTVIINRVKGLFRPFFEGDVENFDGDSRLYPLTETFYQRYRLELDLLTARQVYQFGVWCFLDGFRVNNVSLRATTFPEIEQLGDSNYFSFKVDLGYTGNILAVQQDEVILDTSTGTELPNQSISFPINHDGKTRLTIDGGFMTIGGDYISI